MSEIVNRRDLDFLFYELFDFEAVLAHSRYKEYDRAAIDQIFDTAEAIAEEKYLPVAAKLDQNPPAFVNNKVEIIPEVGDALNAYAEAGLFASGFDEAVGGLQLPWTVNMAVNGIFSCANVAIANYSMLTIANANMLIAFGGEQQIETYLPKMLEGQWYGTMCLSEPQAGSSLSDIRTKAEPIGDGSYRITGSKMWISGGDHELSENIIHMVLAKIPGGPSGVKGISLFVVPRYRVKEDGSPGEWNNVNLAGLNHKMGQRGTVNCLLNFGEDGDCIGHLVGEPNKGLQYMFHMMNEARIGVGQAAVMLAQFGFLHSLDYARNRPQGRHPQNKDPDTPQIPISEHADVKRMLLAQKAAVEGALSLITYCTYLIDLQKIADSDEERERLGLLLDILTPIAKSWPSEYCLEANKHAIQILGGYGYTTDYPVERLYRDNRLNHIHEGAFGIQGLDILGRKVRIKNGESLRLLLADIKKTIKIADTNPTLSSYGAALQDALEKLENATAASIDCNDLNLSLANATLYLDAIGHIVIAWMWLRQAIAANKGLASSEEKGFYEGKLAACRYFYRYELPLAKARLNLVSSLDDTCANVRAEQFIGL